MEPKKKSIDKDRKKSVDLVKDRYENKESKKREKIMREPKKLEANWEEKAAEKPMPNKLPDAELVMCEASSKHVDNKSVYEKKEQMEPVNRRVVEKVAPPQITQNFKKMFESGKITDAHEVRKTKIELKSKDGGVFENEPVVRDDVVRGYDTSLEELQNVGKGTAKMLKNKWNNISFDENDKKPKEPIKLFDETQANSSSSVVENQPEIRDDVVKSEYVPDNLAIEHGKIKNLGKFFHEAAEDHKQTKLTNGSQCIEIDRSSGPTILENEPEIRDDVVRSGSIVPDNVFQKGKIKNTALSFLKCNDEKPAKKSQQIVLDKDNGPSIIENEPEVRTDVVKCNYVEVEELQKMSNEKGKIRNIASSFTSENKVYDKPNTPIVIDRSMGPTIVENEPTSRTDVVNSSSDQSNGDSVVIKGGSTKNMVTNWLKKDSEELMKPNRLLNDIDGNNRQEISRRRQEWLKQQNELENKKENGPTQLVRFTPPRELTPPPLRNDTVLQSFGRITLASTSPPLADVAPTNFEQTNSTAKTLASH